VHKKLLRAVLRAIFVLFFIDTVESAVLSNAWIASIRLLGDRQRFARKAV